MTINEKIDEIRKIFCGGDNKKFAEMLGFSPQYASNICKEGKSVGESQKMHILSVFPSISKSWLFADEGEMLKQIEESEITIEKTLPIYYMNISERIKRYITYKDIKTRRFEILCGLSNGYVRNIYDNIGADKLEAILKSFPELNRDWLLYGEGEMLKPTEKEPEIEEPQYTISQDNKNNGVPYYDVDFIGGFDLVENDQTLIPTYRINFAQYNNADSWVNISGHSMEPQIGHGDIIALKELYDWEDYVLYGEVYAIVTDQYRTVKRINKSAEGKEYLKLVPINKDFDEQDIKKSIVRKVYQVLGCAKKIF